MASQSVREELPQETTPLLRSASPEPQPETAETDDNEQQQQEQSSRATLSQVDKRLFVRISVSLGFHLLGLLFILLVVYMESYGRHRYEFYGDWALDDAMRALATISIWAVPFTIGNLVWMRRQGKAIHPLINVLYFGFAAFLCTFFSLNFIGDRFYNHPGHCATDDDVNIPDGKGTYEECLEWKIKYEVLVWTFIAILTLFSFIQIYILIMLLVELSRNRPRPSAPPVNQSRWTLPVGQFSVEVSFRWGPPASPGEAPRRSDTPRQESA